MTASITDSLPAQRDQISGERYEVPPGDIMLEHPTPLRKSPDPAARRRLQ